jgi:hypothetical protein
MDKFDEAAAQYLEEGKLSRLGQRVKNIGRSIEHPLRRAFGSDDRAMDAATSTQKGYKKRRMLEDILTNAVQDLQKLGVISADTSTKQIVGELALSISQHFLWDEKDTSALGRNAVSKSIFDDGELPHESSEPDSPPELNLKRGDDALITTRKGRKIPGKVVGKNPNGTYTIEYKDRHNRPIRFAYNADQLQKI